MNRKLSDREALFAKACGARQTEVRRALRDPAAWREQLFGIPLTLLKIASFVMITAVSGRFVTDIDRASVATISAFMAPVIVPLNPGHFFWRNVFIARGDAAFQRVIDESLT